MVGVDLHKNEQREAASIDEPTSAGCGQLNWPDGRTSHRKLGVTSLFHSAQSLGQSMGGQRALKVKLAGGQTCRCMMSCVRIFSHRLAESCGDQITCLGDEEKSGAFASATFRSKEQRFLACTRLSTTVKQCIVQVVGRRQQPAEDDELLLHHQTKPL